MAAEALEEYVLASEEATYEYPGEHASMGFMASGGLFYDGNNSHWEDHKQPSFIRLNYSDNTNYYTVAVFISVSKEAIRNETDKVNTPMKCWGCINSPMYNADRFHTYSN